MGVDITACEGVLAQTEDIVKLVNGKNKQHVLDYWHDWFNASESIAEYGDGQMCGFVMKDTFEPPAATDASMLKIGVIRKRLENLVNVDGTGLDCGVVFRDEVHDFFQGLLYIIAPKLPCLEGVEAWGSSRYQGYDVPKGVACFVFDVEDCFKRVPTAAGKRLKAVLGNLDVTSWSDYSV